jgi:site-specific DNA-methyltransferase (adenine-specific)
MTEVKLMLGDCLDKMKELPDNSVDSIVTDPPYGINFMGRKWDYEVPSQEIWKEALRVLKPGGHLLAFAGTRTQHRMAVNIEDAGFEIRDMVTYLYDTNTTAQQLFESLTPEQMKLFDATFGRDGMMGWGYGSGFPKSLDISKAIDKMSGAEREIISETKTNSGGMAHISKTNAEHGFRPNAYTGNSEDKSAKNVIQITAPATDEAKQWNGWGTALKPALEPITVARKPLSENTVAANVLKYGTGGINIDESRVDLNGTKKTSGGCAGSTALHNGGITERAKVDDSVGRFPANLIHDGSEEVIELFPNTKSVKGNPRTASVKNQTKLNNSKEVFVNCEYSDTGSAARFFYCAKTSKKDRNEGLENLPDKEWKHEGAAVPERANRPFIPSKNNHPTVKPTELMRYLVKLVTPPNGTVLDPFMGSGSTGKAAKLEGFNFIGIELDPEYIEIAKARIDAVQKKTTLDNFFSDDA